MPHIVVEVRPIRAHRLRVKFDDGVAGEVDVAQLIKFDGVFASLKEPKCFAEVFLNRELGTVCWPNGADLDPVVLYSTITGTNLPGSEEQPLIYDLLVFAINNKRLITFQYQGRQRTAEPHDYGIADGIRKLLIYQIRGESKTKSIPGWKLLKENEIRRLKILEESFPGGRTVPSGQHKKWDRLFIRVSPAA